MSAQPPQPNLAWQFESSNVDYVTGVSPSNSTFVPTSIQVAPTYVSGKYGKGIYFNNQNSIGLSGGVANSFVWYSGSNFVNFNSNNFTICFWVNPYFSIPAPTGNQIWVNISDSQCTYQFGLNTNTSTTRPFLYINASPPPSLTNPTSPLVTGTWSHQCATFSNVGMTGSNTYVNYYFNGALQASSNVGKSGTSTFVNGLQIGSALGNGAGAWVSIDDLRVYNTALSAAQVQTIYAAQGMPNQMSLTSSAGTPQPSLAWQFESSNVDYVTGLAPSLSTAGTYAAPSGGTITTVAGQRIHKFTSVGATNITFLVPVTVQVLVVAGGGGGGGVATLNLGGGGGGAGEYYYSASYSIAAGTYTVVVGAGGTAGLATGADGGDGGISVFGSLSANGGGGGSSGGTGNNGRPGGSGGGSGRSGAAATVGGASIKTAGGLGNKGGDNTTGTQFSGAGGGGSGSAGTNASASGTTPVAAGSGTASSISGASVTYASGGTGGARSGTYTPGAGTPNQGDGGDGAPAGGSTVNGAVGGSGIVIISYVSALYPAPTYVSGIYGQAISFNNQSASATFANSYVTYTLTSDTSNSYSLSCWINPLHAIPPTINPNYVVLRDTGGYYSIQNFATNSVAGFYANEGVTGGQGTTFSGLLTTGKWDHHCFVLSNVGATSSNTIVTYYFNGTTQASGNVQRTNGFSTFSALDLGYRSGSANSGAWCSIDDLRLFNRALSAAQVQSIYNAQGMPSQVNLGGSGTITLQ